MLIIHFEVSNKKLLCIIKNIKINMPLFVGTLFFFTYFAFYYVIINFDKNQIFSQQRIFVTDEKIFLIVKYFLKIIVYSLYIFSCGNTLI